MLLDVLLATGARVGRLTQATATGDVTGWLTPEISFPDRVLLHAMAADHPRLNVIDALLAAGTPIDSEDDVTERQALSVAASNGRPVIDRHLLASGAYPNHRDRTFATEPGRAGLTGTEPQSYSSAAPGTFAVLTSYRRVSRRGRFRDRHIRTARDAGSQARER